MGNTSSFEDNLRKSSSTIAAQHTKIDEAISRINSEGDRIIGLIMERNYTDREAVCRKIAYQKVDELASFFPVETLEGVRYQMGITVDGTDPNTPYLETNRRAVCLSIVNFYMKKINLITNIQKELPNCKNMEREVYNNLSQKLQSKGISNEQWLEIYNKLEKFNSDIVSRQKLIEREMERVRTAKSMKELDGIAATVNGILAKSTSMCKNYENELILYSDKNLHMKDRMPIGVGAVPIAPPSGFSMGGQSQVYVPSQVPVVPVVVPQAPVVAPVVVSQVPVPVRPTTVTVKKDERKPVPTFPVNSGKSKPVRVFYEFNISGKGQVSVKKDELVTYLGSNSRGWSRIKTSDGRVGWVPHSYLSHK